MMLIWVTIFVFEIHFQNNKYDPYTDQLNVLKAAQIVLEEGMADPMKLLQDFIFIKYIPF